MWYKLAVLMGKSVDQTKEEVDSEEFANWLIFLNKEPMGFDLLAVMIAQLCVLTAEANRDRKKRTRPYTIADFLPDFWKRKGKMKEGEILFNKNQFLAMMQKKGLVKFAEPEGK